MDTCDMCGDVIEPGMDYRADESGLYCVDCVDEYQRLMHVEFGDLASPYRDENLFDPYDAYERDDPKILSFL